MAVRLELSAAQKEQLRKKMDTLVLRNRKGLEQAFSAAGLDMQNKAKEMAPVGTPESTGIPGYIGGTLRQSIRKETINDGLGVRVSTNVKYAVYQNNGTSRVAGKRFMEGGFAAGVQRLLRTLKIR